MQGFLDDLSALGVSRELRGLQLRAAQVFVNLDQLGLQMLWGVDLAGRGLLDQPLALGLPRTHSGIVAQLAPLFESVGCIASQMALRRLVWLERRL